MARVRDPGRAARARRRRRARSPGRARARWSTSRWPTARCRGWRWSPARTSPTARCRAAASCRWPASLICYRPYECADGWVTLGRAGAEVLAGVVSRRRARGPDRGPVRAPRLGRARAGAGDLPLAHARASGRRSRASTTAAWSRCSSSTRRSTPSSCARARWSSRSTSPAPSSRCASSACRSSWRARPAITRACPVRRSASTPRRCCSRAGYSDAEVAELLASGAVAGPGRVAQDTTLRA